jgi:hypothetical protein
MKFTPPKKLKTEINCKARLVKKTGPEECKEEVTRSSTT